MSLDTVIEENMKKVMIVGDIHAPYHDQAAINIVKIKQKEYKPDVFVINGDLCDMYSISVFSKSPARKKNFADEIKECNQVLDDLLKNVPKGAEKVFLEGNHEHRLQRFVWENPAFYKLDAMDVYNLLNLKERGVKIIRADGDYWKGTDNYKIADSIILHGDNRLDGASYSRYGGYSAKNTLFSLSESVFMNHTHRLAEMFHKTPSKTIRGVECGCLCAPSGHADWQQGFVTFEIDKGKSYNVRLHYIEKGKMVEDGKIYKG